MPQPLVNTVKEAGRWDIIVVGSGSNGLTAAAYLAKAGKKVLVLEKQSYPGGGVASMPMTSPGFSSERHSAVHHLILGNPLITEDELDLQKKYGLEYKKIEPCYTVLRDEAVNGVMAFYQNRQKTVDMIRNFSSRDAEAWTTFSDLALAICDIFVPAMFEPPADLSAQIAASGIETEIAWASQASVLDVIQKHFVDDKVSVGLLRMVSEVCLAHPKKEGTGLYVYLIFGMLEKFGYAVPKGGGSSFTKAVINCIEAHGGQIRLNTEVTKILTKGGDVSRAYGVQTASGVYLANDAIVAQIHPHHLNRLVEGLAPSLARAAKAVRPSEFTIVVIHMALKEKLKFKAGPVADQSMINTWSNLTLDEVVRGYDSLAKGELADPLLVGGCDIANADPTRAPPGKGLLHIVAMVRPELAQGGIRAWESIKEEFAQRLFAKLGEFAINATPDIVDSYHIVTPLDHHNDSASFPDGDICGCQMDAGQLGVNRPTPELAQYRVPGVKGLYLTGPFMHPGGGVWGGGRPTAMRVFEDLGLDFASVLSKGGRSAHL